MVAKIDAQLFQSFQVIRSWAICGLEKIDLDMRLGAIH